MFSALRQDNTFYILEKGENPNLKTASVVSVSNPVPKYKSTSFTSPLSPIETVVDVVVKTKDDTIEFKQLPANLSIANFGTSNVVVSESREAMLAEVEAMQRNSKDAISSVPYHKSVVEACERIIGELNPQFAKEKEQEAKIGALEGKMNGIEKTLDEMMSMMRGLSSSQKTKN